MPRLSELVPTLTSSAERVPALVAESPILNSSGPTWERTAEVRTHAVASNADPLVHLLTKRAGPTNAFPMGITLGRIDTNDIAVDDSSISRFHAWFQKDERTGLWAVTDAESKNGSFIDDRKLMASAREPLVDCVLLRFGDVEFRFVLPDTLRSLARGGPVHPAR